MPPSSPAPSPPRCTPSDQVPVAAIRRGARVAAGIALAGLLGCTSPGAPGSERVVIDGLGRRVVLPHPPLRVVALAPSVTESIAALGLQDRLVGITDFCQAPPSSRPIARVGGILNPSLETIRALRPDLLIGSTSGNDPALADQLAAFGLPFYAMHVADTAGVPASLRSLAAALGEPARGEAAAAALENRLAAVEARVAGRPRPGVLFIVWGDPLVVPGRPALLTDALARAGGVSITADAPAAWPAFEVESAIARQPEVILTTEPNRSALDRLAAEPAWAGVPAVRTGRLYVVSDAIEQPGPRVVAGIEEVAAVLHDPAP